MNGKAKSCTGPNIQRYREEAGLSYAALSRGLRERGIIISARRLKGIEKQTSEVYVKDLLAFARFFGVRIADLFDK